MAIIPHEPVDVSGFPDQNLMKVLMADNASLSDRAACKLELERRAEERQRISEKERWKRDFWTKGIILWITLAIAILSLILGIWNSLK